MRAFHQRIKDGMLCPKVRIQSYRTRTRTGTRMGTRIGTRTPKSQTPETRDVVVSLVSPGTCCCSLFFGARHRSLLSCTFNR